MEVESSGDPIDIEDFSCKKEVRDKFALKRFKIDLFEVDSPASDKLRFIGRLPIDSKRASGQLLCKSIELLVGNVPKRCLRHDVGKSEQPLPQI